MAGENEKVGLSGEMKVNFEEDNQLESEFIYLYFLPILKEVGETAIFIHCDGKDDLYSYLQKKKDIDVISENRQRTRNISWSLKTVKDVYRRIFIETISNLNKGTPGWALYSEADYLVYTMGFPDRMISYRFPTKSLKVLDLSETSIYPKGYGETRDRGGRLWYKTEGRLVPPEDIEEITERRIEERIPALTTEG